MVGAYQYHKQISHKFPVSISVLPKSAMWQFKIQNRIIDEVTKELNFSETFGINIIQATFILSKEQYVILVWPITQPCPH